LFLEIRKSEESSNYEMQQKYFCTVLWLQLIIVP
jgi:hypothetical protein